MSVHEKVNGSVEYYTPKYIFDAMCVRFDMDVAHPKTTTHVPADTIITENSLDKEWMGFLWMNPPFLSAQNKLRWINRFVSHGNGVALLPDQTSSVWWHTLAAHSDAVLFVKGRIKFITPNGIAGQPANGTTLFAIGSKGVEALMNAAKNNLGILMVK